MWGYHTSTFFLKIFANMYRERKTWSSRKFGERIFFLAKMTFSRWKNLEQPSCVSGGKPAFLACRCCKFRNGANDVCVLSIYSDRPLVFLNIWTHTVDDYSTCFCSEHWSQKSCVFSEDVQIEITATTPRFPSCVHHRLQHLAGSTCIVFWVPHALSTFLFTVVRFVPYASENEWLVSTTNDEETPVSGTAAVRHCGSMTSYW